MGRATSGDIRSFLTRLGEIYPHAATVYLLGGGALCLLGSPRQTLDIDYASNISTVDPMLQTAMEAVAAEMDLEIEPIAFDAFIPAPEGANQRHRLVGQFGRGQV